MCAAPSAFVCIEINAIRNMELFLRCFKHTAIILHITVYVLQVNAQQKHARSLQENQYKNIHAYPHFSMSAFM